MSGWGGGSSTRSALEEVTSKDQVCSAVRDASSAGRKVLARGLGRAYGDAAQCAGGVVLDCTALAGVLDIDWTSGVARVEAGCSLDELLRLVTQRGWFLPVVPGTAQVTVGGAIAADVHGKNHHRDGTFSSFVERLTLVDAAGVHELAPTGPSAARFWATVGGMGLTGVVVEATIRLRPVETTSIVVDTSVARDLEDALVRLRDADGTHRYSVAWLDGLAHGRHLGRAVVSAGEHARVGELPVKRRDRPLGYPSANRPSLPRLSASLVRKASVVPFNELWYRKAALAGDGAIQHASSFFFPLDALSRWNRLYGPRGFTQYQFVVPFDAADVLWRVLETVHASPLVPSLCVLKSFGAAGPAPMSFPMPGWTLAMDFPLGAGIAPTFDRLDDLVADAGGRVYLAKDGRLRPELLSVMYPRLKEWRESMGDETATRPFRSDLAARLDLIGR